MPISGVVITSKEKETQMVLDQLSLLEEIEIHGADEKGNIVAVLDTKSSEAMEKLIDRINKNENVLHVGLTYLNTEDEAEAMERGEETGKPFGYRKPLNPES